CGYFLLAEWSLLPRSERVWAIPNRIPLVSPFKFKSPLLRSDDVQGVVLEIVMRTRRKNTSAFLPLLTYMKLSS
ncbi:hypothetical protein QN360_04790, partial [Glaciimonas sp. CA11.2]|uniref:hypothetical protein n=1 Tax=Glaciimonas sp. CA11.2 TaxID=3048601 RepID=UPI002B23E461